MNTLGLIPARGGSSGIPRKNIVPVLGRPLLTYTCEAALASRLLTRIVVTTDDEEIAAVARSAGAEVPFLRPAELARADTPSAPVALHAVEWLRQRQDWEADVVVLLQPTSPLRRAAHIDEALARMATTEADTVVSVVPVPHRFSPYNVGRVTHGRWRDFWEEPLPFDRLRRQAAPQFYARNGPAVIAARTPVLRSRRSFFGDSVVTYEMTEADSVDIDTPFDLRLAEFLLASRRGAD